MPAERHKIAMRTVVSTTKTVLLVALLLTPFTSVAAQEQPLPLEPEQRVRVTAPNLGINKQVVTFKALRGDTLIVSADSTMAWPLAAITRLDVYRRRGRPGIGAVARS